MKTFLKYRLLRALTLLLGVTLLAFLLMQSCPGNFLDELSQHKEVSADYIAKLHQQYGLNRAWYIQYFYWLKSLCCLDFGESWTYHMPVSDLLYQRAGATFFLALAAWILGWILAIPCALIAASYANGWWDRCIKNLSYIFASIPNFFLALLAVYFFSNAGYLPIVGTTSLTYEFMTPAAQILDRMCHLLLPAGILSLHIFAHIFRITRNCYLDVVEAPYIRVARSKGLSWFALHFKHAFKNTLNPLISYFGFAFASLLSGAVLIENVFNYPGLGQLLFEAFLAKDAYLVMNSVVLGTSMIIAGNLLADILLRINDPRLRNLDT